MDTDTFITTVIKLSYKHKGSAYSHYMVCMDNGTYNMHQVYATDNIIIKRLSYTKFSYSIELCSMQLGDSLNASRSALPRPTFMTLIIMYYPEAIMATVKTMIIGKNTIK